MAASILLLIGSLALLKPFGGSNWSAINNSWKFTDTINQPSQKQPQSNVAPAAHRQYKPLKPRPLLNASQEELKEYAMEMVYAREGGVISGIPEVVIAKLITKEEDLYKIGLGKMIRPKLECEKDRPFKPAIVAVIKGNLNADAYVGGGRASIPVGYILFTVNPETGFVGLISPGGGYADDIRRALKDPTFPKDIPRNQKVIREVSKAPRATPAKAECYP
jgi:hypothetical protein